MANDLSVLMPKILAQSLLTLRQIAIAPRLVNRGYEPAEGERGSTVTIPIPSAVVTQDVAPANTPPTTADTAPTSVTLVMDQWKEAPFYLTDKDLVEVAEQNILPMQAAEAVKSIANTANAFILSKYVDFYSQVGTPGTTPFATDLAVYLAARKVLNNNLAPMDDRVMLIDTDAEANALNLNAFQDASFRGDTAGIIDGQIGRKLGALWIMTQTIPRHTAGTGTGYLVNNGAGYPAGTKTLTVDTGTGTYLPGDIVTFAGHTQTYAIVSTVGGGTITSITLANGLAVAVADNVAITRAAGGSMNLLFHRDAIAFATRVLPSTDPSGQGRFLSMVDPVSGLSMRLEVSREHKRTRWSLEMLYGGKTTRPEWGVRVAG